MKSVANRVALGIFLAAPALAQTLTPPEGIAAARKALKPDADHEFRCTVEPVAPVLLYTVPQVAAGFSYSIPIAQYTNGRPEHGWSAVLRLTHDGDEGSAVYFTGAIEAPAPDREKAYGLWTYWLGRGTYSALLAISDHMGGVCRTQWSITVSESTMGSGRGLGESDMDSRTATLLADLKLGTPDGAVRAAAAPVPAASSSGWRRITIFLDVPPNGGEQVAALDALENLIARVPVPAVRLVAISLAEGRELFRQDPFAPGALKEIQQTFSSVGYRVVNVAELQKDPIKPAAELLDALLQQELREHDRAEAVLFLGLSYQSKLPRFRFSTPPQRPLPRFYYLHLVGGANFSPPRMVVESTPQRRAMAGRGPTTMDTTRVESMGEGPLGEDPVAQVLSKVGGKTWDVFVAKDFDQGIVQLVKASHR